MRKWRKGMMNPNGYVYFVGPVDWRVGRVKIGFTNNPPRNRMQTFQTGSPYPLEVYAFLPATYDFERMLHETFAPLRSHGEWFHMDGRLLALVGDLYGQKFGKIAHTPTEFFNSIAAVMENDDPVHPLFCTPEEWIGSTVYEPIRGWLHDMMDAELDRWRSEQPA